MTDIWQLSNPSELEAEQFDNLEHVLAAEGEPINTSDMSTLARVKVGDSNYYITKYPRGGRHFPRPLRRSRVLAEWYKSMYFASMAVPPLRIHAFGYP